jgi:uncharacterized protein YeaO (DUF488 family)
MTILVKKAYETPTHDDGFRVLIDRIWPRGLEKSALQVSDWLKDLAPSTTLRQWFDHDPRKWEDFKRRYFSELDQHQNEIRELLADATADEITLVYSAKNAHYNNAVALKEYIEEYVH